MKSSKGGHATGAPDSPEVAFSLKTANNMRPLVQRVVEDIQVRQRALDALEPERARLDRRKRNLDWPQRQRRYQLQDDLAKAERELEEVQEELAGLGVVLFDEVSGRVGFPTMVNNRRAYFSWQLGEDGLHSWHFAEEEACRPIPAAWLKELSLAGK